MVIGADLSQAPDVNFDCSVIPFVNSGFAPGGPSCDWGTPIFDPSASSELGLAVPGTGTITQVKLRVGTSTGPMQVVVLRTLYNPADLPDDHCCVAEAASQVFTPAANAITTVNVALPVGADSTPGDNPFYLDEVGLAILEDGVAVPLIDDTSLPVESGPFDVYEAPVLPTGQGVLASDPSGFELDMQAVWYPAGQSPAPAGSAADATHAAAVLDRDLRSPPNAQPALTSGTIRRTGPLDAPIWAACPASPAAQMICRLAAAFAVYGLS